MPEPAHVLFWIDEGPCIGAERALSRIMNMMSISRWDLGLCMLVFVRMQVLMHLSRLLISGEVVFTWVVAVCLRLWGPFFLEMLGLVIIIIFS